MKYKIKMLETFRLPLTFGINNFISRYGYSAPQGANFDVEMFLRFSTLLDDRRNIDVESTSKFQRLSKFQRFFDDRRIILRPTCFNGFSTTFEILTSIQR